VTAAVAERRPLSFARTVPREIAHRRAVGEVFVTDSVSCGPAEALLAFQIPRAHSLWADRARGRHDVFAVGEAARQAAFVFFHQHLGLAVGLPFSMQSWRLRVLDPAALADDERTPLEGQIRYRATRKQVTAVQGSVSIEGSVLIDGRTALEIASDVVWASREDYQALRAYQRSRKPLVQDDGAPAERYRAKDVGRADQRNVVLGPPAGAPGDTHRLVIDLSHPAFFDHSYDHVPGPLMLEGLRQVALLSVHRRGLMPASDAQVAELDARFTGFAEFEGPVEYTADEPATAAGGLAVDVRIAQFGTVLANGRITLCNPQESS
jgi:hypothetical protein